MGKRDKIGKQYLVEPDRSAPIDILSQPMNNRPKKYGQKEETHKHAHQQLHSVQIKRYTTTISSYPNSKSQAKNSRVQSPLINALSNHQRSRTDYDQKKPSSHSEKTHQARQQ
jgi:hypothetical protein